MSFSFGLFWFFTKLQRWLFALVWRVFMLLYFAIGLGALSMLFLIESQFFMQLTQHALLGYGIAAIFEVTKVGTSVIKQAVSIANQVCRVRVSALVQGMTALLQVALVIVTLFASLVVVTSYLDGSALEGRAQLSARRVERLQPVIDSTLTMLEDGLKVTVKRSTFTSVAALLLSALFQGIVYIVFGHVLATQSREIEHIFEGKMQRIEAKKNFSVSR